MWRQWMNGIWRWVSARRRPIDARGRLGARGERLAERYLRRQGYRIVGRDVRNRFGELDLIAVSGRTVVFVEVKTRRTVDPEEGWSGVLSDEQQVRITRAAFAYRKRHRILTCPARFDLICILWPVDGRPILRHWRDALETTGLDDGLY